MDTSGLQSQMKDSTRLGALFSIFYFIITVITPSRTTFFKPSFLLNSVLSLAGKWGFLANREFLQVLHTGSRFSKYRNHRLFVLKRDP